MSTALATRRRLYARKTAERRSQRRERRGHVERCRSPPLVLGAPASTALPHRCLHERNSAECRSQSRERRGRVQSLLAAGSEPPRRRKQREPAAEERQPSAVLAKGVLAQGVLALGTVLALVKQWEATLRPPDWIPLSVVRSRRPEMQDRARRLLACRRQGAVSSAAEGCGEAPVPSTAADDSAGMPDPSIVAESARAGMPAPSIAVDPSSSAASSAGAGMAQSESRPRADPCARQVQEAASAGA
jgi:hypothetical protein